MLWMGVLKNALQKSVRYPDLQIVDKKYFCKCYNEKVKKKRESSSSSASCGWLEVHGQIFSIIKTEFSA